MELYCIAAMLTLISAFMLRQQTKQVLDFWQLLPSDIIEYKTHFQNIVKLHRCKLQLYNVSGLMPKQQKNVNCGLGFLKFSSLWIVLRVDAEVAYYSKTSHFLRSFEVFPCTCLVSD